MEPVNPTAAALGRYGDIPVSLNNGTTDISIPIYTIEKSWIKLPIVLSYNSGGMKVEDVASWVGMGWSLNFGGSISRQVRGKADIIDSLYIVNMQNKVLAYISGQMTDTSAQFYLEDIVDGHQDSEEDLFLINMNGFTGRFFYTGNATTVTQPDSKMKIQYGHFNGKPGWKVTTTDGTQYYFLDVELTATSTMTTPTGGATFSGPDTTNWYLSRIVNANNTDSIVFGYEAAASYSLQSLGTEIAYALIPSAACNDQTKPNLKTTLTNTFTTKRLTSIKTGELELDFIKNPAQRCDVPGDYALQSIQLKNRLNQVIKTYQLYQSYRVGNTVETTCSATAPEMKRLFLDSIRDKSATGIYEPYYRMIYNNGSYPSRLSTKQDYWGYYSSEGNPNSLIPDENNTKAPDPVLNQLGSLKSLYYPTGGRTDFEYETNTANNLPYQFSSHRETQSYGVESTALAAGQVSVDFTVPASAPPDGDSAVVTNSFMHSGSSLNDPDNLYLGHATIKLINQFTHDSLDIPCIGIHTVSLYPGTYTLYASYFIYNNTIPKFGVGISWNYFSDIQEDKNVGGIRIKSIRDFDELGHQVAVHKFSYNRPDNDSSSGFINNLPSFNGLYIHQIVIGQQPSFCAYNTTQSFSNYPLVSGFGSTVGYGYVKELIGENGEGGMNEYYYTTAKDYPDILYSNVFPFPPTLPQTWGQGLLKQENIYAKSGTTFNLVQSHTYKYGLHDTRAQQFSRSLKVGEHAFYEYENAVPPGDPRAIQAKEYENYTGRNELLADTVKDYYPGGTVTKVTTYAYDPTYYHKNSETETNSDGKKVKTQYTYAPALGASAVKTQLINKNMIDIPLTTKSYADTVLTSTVKNTYALFNTNQVALQKTQTSTYNNALQTEITYNKYDGNGNPLVYTTTGNATTALLWGYIHSYPVAEIKNVDTAALTAYLNAHPTVQATCDNPASDAALRTAIQQLRTQFPDAAITGFTYKPPLGITSRTEPNGVTTYYEYDAFGRLSVIRDDNQSIIKSFTYKYQSTQ